MEKERALLDQALALAKSGSEYQSDYRVGVSLFNLAQCCFRQNDFKAAQDFLRQAKAIFEPAFSVVRAGDQSFALLSMHKREVDSLSARLMDSVEGRTTERDKALHEAVSDE